MNKQEDELAEFTRAALQGIRKGVSEGFLLTEPVRFSLAVVKIKEGGGGLKIHVVEAGGKYKAEEITKIEFEVSPTDYMR